MYGIHVMLPHTLGKLATLGTLLGRHSIGLDGDGVFSFGDEDHAHFLVK